LRWETRDEAIGGEVDGVERWISRDVSKQQVEQLEFQPSKESKGAALGGRETEPVQMSMVKE
jgi:hypothetical protein